MNRRERRLQKKLAKRGGGTGPAPVSATAAGLLERALGYLRAGRPAEALPLYDQVLSAHPGNPDALNLGGVAAFQAGAVDQGLAMLEAAVAHQPEYVDAHNNLGNVLRAVGRLDEAEAAYRRALDIEPLYVDAHYNLGIVLEAQGRLDVAEEAYALAVQLRPDFAEAYFNLGNVLKARGKLDGAVAAYARATDIRADYGEAHTNRGAALQELGRFDDAVAAYDEALAAAPAHADAHYNRGTALQELERFDDAVAAYEKTLDIEPGYAAALVNLGYAFQELGRLDEALAAYRRAIALEPDFAQVHANLADVHLERGDPGAALAVCDAFLEGHPGDTAILAFKAVVLDELGEREGVRGLLGLERLIRPLAVSAPAAFADMTAFNRALADHVLAHPTLVYAPTSHATRKGRHSGELLIEPKGPMGDLETAIRAAAEDYLTALAPDPTHPFLAGPPARFGINAWAVVLGAEGHQIPHIHPSAWLSGVYYVEVPASVGTADPARAGWIEFGRPPDHFHCRVEPEVRAIAPEAGLMVLFPSYLYHRTIPFETSERRISIAFDVVPAA